MQLLMLIGGGTSQNVSLVTVANGDASKRALVVVPFLPIDRHRHHQRAAAMGVGVTRVRVNWNARRHAPATSVACPSASSIARS